jgi:hypothetical protein
LADEVVELVAGFEGASATTGFVFVPALELAEEFVPAFAISAPCRLVPADIESETRLVTPAVACRPGVELVELLDGPALDVFVDFWAVLAPAKELVFVAVEAGSVAASVGTVGIFK